MILKPWQGNNYWRPTQSAIMSFNTRHKHNLTPAMSRESGWATIIKFLLHGPLVHIVVMLKLGSCHLRRCHVGCYAGCVFMRKNAILNILLKLFCTDPFPSLFIEAFIHSFYSNCSEFIIHFCLFLLLGMI